MDYLALAAESFNKSWEWIEKPNRTPEETLLMIDAAMKSKYYWSKVGTKLNHVRSDWMVARVFTEAKLFEAAKIHATQCLEVTLREGFQDIDLFFGYEGLVRIYHLEKDYEKRDKLVEKARRALPLIEKEEDRRYCQSELDRILAMHIE